MADNFKEIFEQGLFWFKFLFLLLHKLRHFIQSTFLNLSKNSATNYLKLVIYFCESCLEIIDFFVVFKTIVTTLHYKAVSLGGPIESSNTWFNKFIEAR